MRLFTDKIRKNNSVVDVLLTSDIKSKDFMYGQSDYNILVIVKNHCHPKSELKVIRNTLKENFITSIIFNTRFIPILTHEEFNTQLIKSYLFRNSSKEFINWFSILTKKVHKFKIDKGNEFPILYNAIQNLDLGLYQDSQTIKPRSKLKSIFRGLSALGKYHPDFVSIKPSLSGKILSSLSYPILKPFLLPSIKKLTWSSITNPPEKIRLTQKVHHKHFIDEILYQHLVNLVEFDFIEDITLTPSLIQVLDEEISGKLFIELHINTKINNSKYRGQIQNLKDGILSFEKKGLKLRIRLISSSLYRLQNREFYYPFPLEPLLRKQLSFSIMHLNYHNDHKLEQIEKACTNFLIIQFMRFRSLEQKTDLIGSKFIKSLNLMYRYFLVLQYLQNNKVEFHSHERDIRGFLTPQFSEIDLFDIVTDAHWKLIKAQMIFLLKKIRAELIRKEPDLSLLKF